MFRIVSVLFLFRYFLMSAPIIGMFSAFTVESGLSPIQIGFTFALFFIACNLFEIPSSIIADKFSRKKVVMVACVIFLLCNGVFLFSQSQATFILHMILAGIGVALFSGTVEALLYDELKAIGKEEKYQKAIGFYQIALSLALSTSLFLGSFLVKYGYFTLIVISLALAFASLCVFTLFMKETPRTKSVAEAHSFREIFTEGRRAITHNKSVLFLALISLIFGSTAFTLGDMAIVTSMELGWLKENIAKIFGINTLFEAAITYAFIKFCGKTKVETVRKLMFATLVLAIAGLYFKQWWSIFCVLPLWWTKRLKSIVIEPKIQDMIPSTSRATATSCISVAFGANYCVLIIALGFVAQHFSWATGYAMLCAMCFTTLIVINIYLRRNFANRY